LASCLLFKEFQISILIDRMNNIKIIIKELKFRKAVNILYKKINRFVEIIVLKIVNMYIALKSKL